MLRILSADSVFPITVFKLTFYFKQKSKFFPIVMSATLQQQKVALFWTPVCRLESNPYIINNDCSDGVARTSLPCKKDIILWQPTTWCKIVHQTECKTGWLSEA